MGKILVESKHPEAERMAQRIRRARIDIANNAQMRYWAGYFHLGTDVVIDNSHPRVRVPIAATNYRSRFFNVEGCGDWSQPELVFLMLHEIGHMLLRHQATYRPALKSAIERKDRTFQQIGPMAIDYVVNSTIIDSPEYDDAERVGLIKMPKSALYDKEYVGLSWQSVYQKLLQNVKGDDNEGGESFDVHLIDPDASEDEENSAAECPSGQSAFDKAVEQEVRASEVMRRAAGTDPGKLSRALSEANAQSLPWQTIFRNHLRDMSSAKSTRTSWSRMSRRGLAQDRMVPGLLRLPQLGRLVVVGDTSGSISPEALTSAAAQIGHIISATPPTALHVLWTDAEVASEQVFAQKDFLNLKGQLQPSGGGGTDMRVAFDYCKEKGINPAAVVVFTDGYTPFPDVELPYPVFWVISSSHINSPTGRTLRWKV